MNPYESVFASRGDENARNYTDTAGRFKKGFVILFTARSGSSQLASLLRTFGLPEPQEFLNYDHISVFSADSATKTPGEYIAGCIEKFGCDGLFGIEIDGNRLYSLIEFLDFSALFPVERTKTVVLLRRDLVAQAASGERARISGRWHVRRGQENRFSKMTIGPETITDAMMWARIRAVLNHELCILKVARRRRVGPESYFYYEDLATNPPMMAHRVARQLGGEPIQPDYGRERLGDYQRSTPATLDPLISGFYDRFSEPLQAIYAARPHPEQNSAALEQAISLTQEFVQPV